MPTTDPAVIPEPVTTAFTFLIERVIGMIELVTSNPVLSLGIAIWVAGASIGLFRRLV